MCVNYEELVHTKSTDVELTDVLNKGDPLLQLQHINMHTTETNVYYNTSTGKIRPYSTKIFRRQIFDCSHWTITSR